MGFFDTFYGPIPENVSHDEALNILANGVKNYLEECPYKMPRDTVCSMVDMWMEHDDVSGDHKFEHLFETVNDIVDKAFTLLDMEKYNSKPSEYPQHDYELDMVGKYPDQELD